MPLSGSSLLSAACPTQQKARAHTCTHRHVSPLPTSNPVSSAWLQRRPCGPRAWKLSPRGPTGPWRSHRSPAPGAAPARRQGKGLVSQRAGGCADGVVETHPLACRVAQPAPPSHSSLAFSPQEGKAGIPPLKRLHLLSPHTQSCSKSPGVPAAGEG